MADRKMADRKMADRKMADRKMAERKMADRKMVAIYTGLPLFSCLPFSCLLRRLNCPQNRAEVAFLLVQRSHGYDDLWAGVIEWRQQTPVPAEDFPGHVAQLKIVG